MIIGDQDKSGTGGKPTRTYVHEDLIVEWRPELCIHCQLCITELPMVFNLDARPWVNLKGAFKDQIIEQVKACPSQALSLGTIE